MKKKHRLEQDYWLSFSDAKKATECERTEFFCYDSQGGQRPESNPILMGKIRHGQYGQAMLESYFDTDGGWIGGIYLIETYQHREPFGLRPLIEWFGPDTVYRWARAVFS